MAGTLAALLGAKVVEEGLVEFLVWAPSAPSVAVRVDGRDHPLERTDNGFHGGRVDARSGDDYLYVLDGGGTWPDPCSRFQPEGIRGPSRVVAVPPVRPGPELRLEELVVYELHVGTFSDDGTFDGVVPHLAALRDLGVTAIEVMPIATFPGDRGWGYDGVYGYAPHPAYGGPDGFARLVDAAHAEGLGVVLDVVYNHIGPGSEAIAAFGPYFTDRYDTFWGDAIDFSQRGVREWAIQNAEQWIRDYRVDGLRLDATHAIFDESEPHVLRELRDRVKAVNPSALVMAEMETGDLRPIEEWGHDAQWADEFHHELHVLLTGEKEGYYAGYGSLDGLAGQYRRTPPEKLVFCSQNHDQVGNRALGDRPATEELGLRASCLLFAPQTPLLFMGEEYGERAPFQFFTDHVDPAIAEATREGRRREFEAFSAFSGQEVPDPQDPATFERSKLTRVEKPGLRDLYRRLLAERRRLGPVSASHGRGQTLAVARGDASLTADFAARTAEVDLG